MESEQSEHDQGEKDEVEYEHADEIGPEATAQQSDEGIPLLEHKDEGCGQREETKDGEERIQSLDGTLQKAAAV